MFHYKFQVWDIANEEMLNEAAMDELIVETGEDGYFYLLKVARFIPLLSTEKKSKDGVEIYAGSVLRYGRHYEIVDFGRYEFDDDENIGFFTKSKHHTLPLSLSSIQYGEYMGNIHENKDLLKLING